jgi:fructokinase
MDRHGFSNCSLRGARIVDLEMTIVSIGEILWDVFADSERLGGAPFNFAVHARRLGHEVLFVSAVGDDDRGRLALAQAAELGLSTAFIRTVPGVPTGAVTVFVDGAGQPAFTIHRPAAYDRVRPDITRIAAAQPDWVYFGTLLQTDTEAREEVRRLLDAVPAARKFYDVNLRRNCYNPGLVRQLSSRADAVKLNDHEAAEFPELAAGRLVALTRGEHGCSVRVGDGRAECPGYRVAVADAVGAGDAFAAAFLHGLSHGWSAAKIGDFANRLGALVASRAGAVPDWSAAELMELEQTSI